MELKDQLLQAALDTRPWSMGLLEELVNIDSNSWNKPGIDAVGTIVREQLEQLGFETEVYAQECCGNTLVGRRKGNLDMTLALIGHLDTVKYDSTGEQAKFRNDGRFAYGPGVLDMKGCLVGALIALKSLVENSEDLPNFVFLLVGDEEIGSKAAMPAIEKVAQEADLTIVIEAARANGAIVVERKGIATLDIRAHGRAVHAGIEPALGINAIEELALKIVKLRELNDWPQGVSLTIGKISGGVLRIVVAEFAEMQVDIRFRTMAQAEKLLKDIRAVLNEPEIEGISLEYDLCVGRPPMTRLPGAELMIKKMEEASLALGIPFLTAATGGVGDGNWMTARGVPTIDGVGPVGDRMCTPEEYLEVETLFSRAARLAYMMTLLTK